MPAVYTKDQLDQYFKHIHYPRDQHVTDPLKLVTELQKHHLARVAFESLSLHYSKHRMLSLDTEDLFVKIVVNGHGGYCMELNTFFSTVLRSLGYTLFNTGARVKGDPEEGYQGWDHMATIVIFGSDRFLVDVGFGIGGPTHPIPLVHGHEFTQIAPQLGLIEYKNIPQHTDPNQRVWVYSSKEDDGAAWRERYCFTEIEFLPMDYEVMNLHTMTLPQSFFVKYVMTARTILNEETGEAEGTITLYKNEVKRRLGAKSEVLEVMKTEAERVKALEKYFWIVLKPEEQKAIKDLASELQG